MRAVLSLVNAVCKVIAWGITLILATLTLIFVMTVTSIAFSIDRWLGLGFFMLCLLIVWMMFYATKD